MKADLSSDKLINRLVEISSTKGFRIDELGRVYNYPLLLLHPEKLNKNRPNILIAAGFHGDEPAGCLGILHFLEIGPLNLISSLNLSFLPLVNPSGFNFKGRLNKEGQDPNRGFCHSDSTKPQPSCEGNLLIKNLPKLKLLAKDGFLSLHEDIEQECFYIYTFENSEKYSEFSICLANELAKYFEPCSDGIIEGSIVKNGIIFRQCDGSFEDLLFHEGVPRTACTETPGLKDLKERIDANAQTIMEFVRFTLALLA
jgi:predicted deacylase